MSSIFESGKQERLMAYNPPDTIIDDRAYNLVMGGVILYGLFANLLMCLYCTEWAVDFILSTGFFFYIIYFGMCVAGILISRKSDSPVISFLGSNLVVLPLGIVVAASVWIYGGAGSSVVTQAVLYTGIITACMIALSTAFPGFFSRLGGILCAILLGVIISEMICMLLGIDQMITAWFGAGVFSLYIGYDFWKSQEYPKTVDNAVDSAVDIYIDIIGLFLRVLQILGNSRSSRR